MSLGIDTQTGSPVFVPDPPEEDRCPRCRKPEDIRCVCGHCGYKYPEEEDSESGWFYVKFALIVLLVAYTLVTVVYWLTEQRYERHPALLDIVKSQWSWTRTLRLW